MRFWIEEGRPGEKAALQKIQQVGESEDSLPTDSDVRCRRCHRVLTNARSIEAGVGWRCRARLAEAVSV